MSDTLSPKVWIENLVLSCARKYGSKLANPTEQKGYRVQLIEFLTRRTPEQPGAAVWALASDGQYYIPVKFATNAVDEFRGINGKLATLEDHWCGIFILKGTFTLQYYRIPRKYINGKPSGLEDTKKLYLEVTRVQYVGSMHEPIFVRPRVRKRDGMPDFVIQQEAVEFVGNIVAVKRWVESLEKGDGDVLKREWDAQNAEEVATKLTNAEQMLKPVRIRVASRDPRPITSASHRKETNGAPSEHWPPFWKQAFKEHRWLFDSTSSEGSSDEEYLKEGDADVMHEILVPILPEDEPRRGPLVEMEMVTTTEALDQPFEPGPSTAVPPTSPGVPSTPPVRSSPSLILTDWAPTPPHRLRTCSSDMRCVARASGGTIQGAVWGNGSVELEGQSDASTTSGKSPTEEGNTTSSFTAHTEQSSASNGLSPEANEAENQGLAPSSSQAKSGRQRPQGDSWLGRLQLSPRRTQNHRGELRTEFSTSHTVLMHSTKRNPAPTPFPPSQPLFTQPRATSTQELVPASVEETLQEVTSSDSIRFPPGQVAVAQESQESGSTVKSTAPESPNEAFVEGPSWEMSSSGSIRIPPSGQIATNQESQQTSATVQNTGEASFRTLDPLTNRDHRWKSKNINAMLSCSPIYPTAPNSPAAETSVGPMDSVSPSSDGDIAYRQYMEDDLRAKEREGLPTREEGRGSQFEIDELDGISSKAPSADESDEETDHKKEESNEQSGIMAGEEQRTQQLSGGVGADEQHKPGQGVLEGQGAGVTSGPEAPPTRSQTRVEESVQPVQGGEPQEFTHIEPPDAEEDGHQKRIHKRLACTPIQESRAHFLRELQTKKKREAEEARQEEAREETETDDAIKVGQEGENRRREGIGTRLGVESTLPFTAREELQDIKLQHESLRTHSYVPTPLHWPELLISKARAPRHLPWPWLLADSDGRSPPTFIYSPPPSKKQGPVLGKRKRVSVGDDILREQARTPPPSSILGISVKKANNPNVLLKPPVQHQGVIKRRKVEFVDTPLEIDFEESGSDSDEIPAASRRYKRKRNAKAPAVQVQDGSLFFRDKPSCPPGFDVPSPLSLVNPRGLSIPGGRKVQSSRPSLYAHHPALSMASSTSAGPVHRPRRVSSQSDAVQQRPTHPSSFQASTRYLSPVSSLFREDRSVSHHPSAARSLSSRIDHSDLSEFGDDLSIMSTDTLPHVDFLKGQPILKKGSSSTQSLRR